MNLCPSEDTYCNQGLNFKTCSFHSDGFHCPKRKKHVLAEEAEK